MRKTLGMTPDFRLYARSIRYAPTNPSASPQAQRPICNHISPANPISAPTSIKSTGSAYIMSAPLRGHFHDYAVAYSYFDIAKRGYDHALFTVERTDLAGVALVLAFQLYIRRAALDFFYRTRFGHNSINLDIA